MIRNPSNRHVHRYVNVATAPCLRENGIRGVSYVPHCGPIAPTGSICRTEVAFRRAWSGGAQVTAWFFLSWGEVP